VKHDTSCDIFSLLEKKMMIDRFGAITKYSQKPVCAILDWDRLQFFDDLQTLYIRGHP
jgi:hypothetical protein